MATKHVRVGVLALQGAFTKHVEMLRKLGVETIEVRKPTELDQCDALIIPGGESTTIFKKINFIELAEPLREFFKTKPVFGTCAGLILMSQNIVDNTMQPFHLLDVSVERNAFGRQVDSFQTQINFQPDIERCIPIPAIFIRAPRIKNVGKQVKVLAKFNDEPVLVQQGFHLGATFHPELTDDLTIHEHWLTFLGLTRE